MDFKKVVRCAVYTRKSTEHNLDLAFNSLAAQRESCEAYIKSQTHDGWMLLPDHYDDGGVSGGSLDRPELRRLLAEILAGRVDIVVVYKVDRLTRSLTDFAKLVDLFDSHNVSFVSVTQAFNTTSSMGRLTLNVLLSFAQFEREVIAERVRDKVAASKRKGLWMGGGVPLGYANQNKRLVIVPRDAEAVRWLFRTYLEVGSIGRLLQKMEDEHVRFSSRETRDGRGRGRTRLGPGSLGYLLRNRCYVGEIFHKGQIHAADHEPIVERDLFNSVQNQLRSNRIARKLKHTGSPSLLKGKLFDSAGNRMTPSHSVKNGIRYRYYVSQAILANRPKEAGLVSRVSAPDLERQIDGFLRTRYAENPGPNRTAQALFSTHLKRVTILHDAIELDLADCGDPSTETVHLARHKKPGAEHSPITFYGAKQEAIFCAIGKARLWIDEITSGVPLSRRQDRSADTPLDALSIRVAADGQCSDRWHASGRLSNGAGETRFATVGRVLKQVQLSASRTLPEDIYIKRASQAYSARGFRHVC